MRPTCVIVSVLFSLLCTQETCSKRLSIWKELKDLLRELDNKDLDDIESALPQTSSQQSDAFKISGLDLNQLLKRDRIAYIVGGNPAAPGKWTWQVALLFKDIFSGNYEPVCGGALIGSQWIITASHCVDKTYGDARNNPSNYKIVLGGYDLKNPSGTEVIATPESFHTHPDFVADIGLGFPADIALVRLSAPVDLAGNGLEAISLPDSGDTFRGADCYITGWGITQAGDLNSYPGELQEAPAFLVPNHQCKTMIAAASSQPKILDSQICVGGDNHATACTGDSGSPLSCHVGGQWKLAGIYSWYVTCSELPSVYTRISSYLDWVAQTIAAG